MASQLTDKERVWRFNYWVRFEAGQIPRRNSYDYNAYKYPKQIWWYPYATRPHHDRIFNRITGLYEVRIRPYEGAAKEIFDEYDRDIIMRTELPPPPSNRALPPAVKVSVQDRDRFLSKCPKWMDAYKEKLIKSDGSW